MDCPSKSTKGKARLLSFATARYRSRESAKLAKHVHECGICSDYVRSQSALWEVLDFWEPEPIAMNFDRKLYQRIETLPPLSFVERLIRFRASIFDKPALPLAVATLLIVAGYALDLPRRNEVPNAVASVNVQPPRPANADRLNADQINSEFEDLQLLYQLDVVKEPSNDTARAM